VQPIKVDDLLPFAFEVKATSAGSNEIVAFGPFSSDVVSNH
jgi:hypothetical protein